MGRAKQLGQGIMGGVIYLLVLSYALIFTNRTGWALLTFVTLLMVMEISSLLGSLKRLQLSSRESVVAQVDEALDILIEMKKIKRRPLWFVRLGLDFYPEREGNLPLLFYGGRKKKLTKVWYPKKRGKIETLPVTLKSRDLFGWFKKEERRQLPVDWLVLPKEHPSTGEVNLLLQQFIHARDQGDSSFLIKNYRPYSPGDPLKQIDWKVSSRKRELTFREYQHYEPSEWVFILYGLKSSYFEVFKFYDII